MRLSSSCDLRTIVEMNLSELTRTSEVPTIAIYEREGNQSLLVVHEQNQ